MQRKNDTNRRLTLLNSFFFFFFIAICIHSHCLKIKIMSLIQLLKYDMRTVSNLVKWGRVELFVYIFFFFYWSEQKTKLIIVKLQYQLSGTTRCLNYNILQLILLRIRSYNKIFKSADWKYDWMWSDTIIYES